MDQRGESGGLAAMVVSPEAKRWSEHASQAVVKVFDTDTTVKVLNSGQTASNPPAIVVLIVGSAVAPVTSGSKMEIVTF